MIDNQAFAAHRLFRTHVVIRSEQVACSRHVGLIQDRGEPEVGQPHVAIHVQQQIGRLDVAMDDTLLMDVVQSIGNLDSHLHKTFDETRVCRRALNRDPFQNVI